MQVTLAAMGGGTAHTLTAQATQALLEAQHILGAARLLAALPQECTQNRTEAVAPAALLAEILRSKAEAIAVVYSGDTGFYSGACGLVPLLKEQGIAVKTLPGVSSVQLLAARLQRPWQSWTLVSAHGTDCDPVKAVLRGQPAFFLTGGALGPGELCARLTCAGLGQLSVTVGEELAYPEEKIWTGTAAEFAERSFAPLSVLLTEPAPCPVRRTAGWPDAAFIRGGVPMTKQLVRAAALAKLAVRPADTVWDVGAGTGSVSVELALAAPQGSVYAVEGAPEACDLILQNREKFCAWNLTLAKGWAPDALKALPAPNAVFIGGTKGSMEPVLAEVLAKNAKARLCISAIALETVTAAVQALEKCGIAAEVTQLAVSETKPTGGLHLLLSNNPTFLITGNCNG